MSAVPNSSRGPLWRAKLAGYREHAGQPARLVVEGRLTRMVGLTLEAIGSQAAIGARCMVVGPDDYEIEAEVVGFAGDRLFLMPIGDLQGLTPNARVIPTDRVAKAPVGEAMLGRVVDGAGDPLDGKGPSAHPHVRAFDRAFHQSAVAQPHSRTAGCGRARHQLLC